MDEMVERIARALLLADDGGNADAILAATEHSGDCLGLSYTCALCEAAHYRDLARAALVAAREPTEAMFMTGGNTAVSNRGDDHRLHRKGKRIGDLAARDAWRTMIDRALKQ